jgi:hypothetical protein
VFETGGYGLLVLPVHVLGVMASTGCGLGLTLRWVHFRLYFCFLKLNVSFSDGGVNSKYSCFLSFIIKKTIWIHSNQP